MSEGKSVDIKKFKRILLPECNFYCRSLHIGVACKQFKKDNQAYYVSTEYRAEEMEVIKARVKAGREKAKARRLAALQEGQQVTNRRTQDEWFHVTSSAK